MILQKNFGGPRAEFEVGAELSVRSFGLGFSWLLLGQNASNIITVYLGPLQFWVWFAYWPKHPVSEDQS